MTTDQHQSRFNGRGEQPPAQGETENIPTDQHQSRFNGRGEQPPVQGETENIPTGQDRSLRNWSTLRWALVVSLTLYCVYVTAKGLSAYVGAPLILCLSASLAFYASAVLFLHHHSDEPETDGGGFYRGLGYVVTISLTVFTAAIGVYQLHAPVVAEAHKKAEIEQQWQIAYADLAAFRRAVLEKISQLLDAVNRDIQQEQQRLHALHGQPVDRSHLTALKEKSKLLDQARNIFSQTTSGSNAGRTSPSHRTGVRYPELDAVPPADVRQARNQLARAFGLCHEAYAVLPLELRQGLTPPTMPEATVTMTGLDEFFNQTRARDLNALRAWAVPSVLEILILCLVRYDRTRTRRLDERILAARACAKRLWHAVSSTITPLVRTIPYYTVSSDPTLSSVSGTITLGSDRPLISLDSVLSHQAEIEAALRERFLLPVKIMAVAGTDGRELDASLPLLPQLNGDRLQFQIEPIQGAIYE